MSPASLEAQKFLSSNVQALLKIRIEAPMRTISIQMIFFIFGLGLIERRRCFEQNPRLHRLLMLIHADFLLSNTELLTALPHFD